MDSSAAISLRSSWFFAGFAVSTAFSGIIRADSSSSVVKLKGIGLKGADGNAGGAVGDAEGAVAREDVEANGVVAAMDDLDLAVDDADPAAGDEIDAGKNVQLEIEERFGAGAGEDGGLRDVLEVGVGAEDLLAADVFQSDGVDGVDDVASGATRQADAGARAGDEGEFRGMIFVQERDGFDVAKFAAVGVFLVGDLLVRAFFGDEELGVEIFREEDGGGRVRSGGGVEIGVGGRERGGAVAQRVDVGADGFDAVRAGDELGVEIDDLVGFSLEDHLAAFEEDGAIADAFDGVRVVRDEDDRAAIGDHLVKGGVALELEAGVADGEGFVDDEDIGVDMRADGEREADGHAAGVGADGLVDEFADAGVVDDGFELGVDFGFAEAEDGRVEVDVFAAGKIGIEAAAEFEKGGDAAGDGDVAGGGLERAGDHLEQRAFAGAVAADDTEALAAADFKGDVADGGELAGAARGGARQGVAEKRKKARGRLVPNRVGFGDALERDDGIELGFRWSGEDVSRHVGHDGGGAGRRASRKFGARVAG